MSWWYSLEPLSRLASEYISGSNATGLSCVDQNDRNPFVAGHEAAVHSIDLQAYKEK